MEILEHLRRTYPAREWLQARRQLTLEMVSGHHIVVRYDLDSASPDGVQFSAEQIVRFYGAGILGDNKLEVAEAIADTIREKTKILRDDVVAQVVMSSRLLDALEAHDMETAKELGIEMLDMLEPYRPCADEIWGQWLIIAAAYTTHPDSP